MTISTLKATQRVKGGKGNARATRRDQQIPAVIYGDKQPPVLVALSEKELVRAFGQTGFFTRLFDLDVEGTVHRVLPRDVQLDPVSDRVIHADFLRVTGNTRIRVFVPIHFANTEKSAGIKRGGTLNVVAHDIELWCPAQAIPDAITYDAGNMEFGDTVHVKDLALPEGTKPTSIQNLTIASLAAPSSSGAEEATPAAAAPAADAKGKAAAKAPAGKAAAPAAAGKAAPAKAPAKPAGKK